LRAKDRWTLDILWYNLKIYCFIVYIFTNKASESSANILRDCLVMISPNIHRHNLFRWIGSIQDRLIKRKSFTHSYAILIINKELVILGTYISWMARLCFMSKMLIFRFVIDQYVRKICVTAQVSHLRRTICNQCSHPITLGNIAQRGLSDVVYLS
jgi:hypothetical protein